MKKILRKISGIILVLLTIFAWSIYSYEQKGEGILVSSSTLSRD